MSFKTLATLALATGLAVAKPINSPQSLPAYHKRNQAISNGFSGNGFNFIDGFNNFNNQQQVIQIQEQNLQIIDNGFQQQVVQQANEVLIVDQQQNGFNNDLNNLFRKSNFRNQRNEVSTVMLVVQEIQIAVDDGRGNQFQQNIFAQSAVVANRGRGQTETVMVFDARTLVAQDILGGGFGGIAGIGGGVAGATGVQGAALPTKTNGVQLLGEKPTWSSVAEDPAATLGGIWQGELEDLQKAENDQADNDANNAAAEQEKQALEEAKAAQDQQNQDQANQDQAAAEGEQNAEDQAKADEQNQDQAAEGEQAAEGQDQAAQGEEQKAEGEKQ